METLAKYEKILTLKQPVKFNPTWLQKARHERHKMVNEKVSPCSIGLEMPQLQLLKLANVEDG